MYKSPTSTIDKSNSSPTFNHTETSNGNIRNNYDVRQQPRKIFRFLFPSSYVSFEKKHSDRIRIWVEGLSMLMVDVTFCKNFPCSSKIVSFLFELWTFWVLSYFLQGNRGNLKWKFSFGNKFCCCKKIKIDLFMFKIDTSDSGTSEQSVYTFQQFIAETDTFFLILTWSLIHRQSHLETKIHPLLRCFWL